MKEQINAIIHEITESNADTATILKMLRSLLDDSESDSEAIEQRDKVIRHLIEVYIVDDCFDLKIREEKVQNSIKRLMDKFSVSISKRESYND